MLLYFYHGMAYHNLTRTPNATIDRPETAARSDAVEGPRRIVCWASRSLLPSKAHQSGP